MLAEALSIGVKFVMSNHLYIFNQEVRMQSKGGPIGLALTGDVAQVFMCWYDRELISRLELDGLVVLLYRRYVDDVNALIKRLSNQEGSTPTVEEERDIMQRVKQIAESIHNSIRVTVDCPSFHEDRKLPILDL